MKIETIIKLKSNPLYIKYLRENSQWYKILNRYPNSIYDFIEQVKKDYQLRPVDKITKMVEYLDFFQSIVSNLK